MNGYCRPAAAGAIDIEAPIGKPLRVAKALNKAVEDVTVVVLDGPARTADAEIREAGSRIRLISDGDMPARS